MRLWSFHPRYLDARGLVALWREALLAQAALARNAGGYSRHPQLARFRAADEPLAAIAAYLTAVAVEAEARGYRFAIEKIGMRAASGKLTVTRGQLLYEWSRYKPRLARRDPARARALGPIDLPEAHPLFVVREGAIEPWERTRE